MACDHIIPARFVTQHQLGDPDAAINLVALCRNCHPKKRRAEDRLCNRTNIVGCLQELNRIGFPMHKVRKAAQFYGLRLPMSSLGEIADSNSKSADENACLSELPN